MKKKKKKEKENENNIKKQFIEKIIKIPFSQNLPNDKNDLSK